MPDEEYENRVEIYEAIQALTPDLYFDDLGSESTEAIEAFYYKTNITELTPESFANTLNLNLLEPKESIARFVPAGPHFIKFVELHAQSEAEERAKDLVNKMQESLRQLTVVVLGEDQNPDVPPQHPVYVVGLDKDGSLVGFKSQVIWT